MRVAALFVQRDGAYYGLEHVDPWDVERDARAYQGPYPVVAHPPCERWGRFAAGGPNVREKKAVGDDGGCFASALASVRRWGGVIEHPEASHAWAAHGIFRPPKSGGWVKADWSGGWTCCVEQGHYGHRARKATWLYLSGMEPGDLPSLEWGKSEAPCYITTPRVALEARRAGATAAELRERWPRVEERELIATPPAFRDLLIGIAARCRPGVGT